MENQTSKAERPTPFERYPNLRKYLCEFERLEREHLKVGQDFLGSGKGNLYDTDLLFTGIINRSLDILDAAKVLVSRWNFTAAAPLLRFQLDSLLRAAYLARARDPEAISRAVLGGESFRKLKDEQGEYLFDARLRKLAQREFPWLDKVYGETSRLVHLSERHSSSTVASKNESERTFEFVIGAGAPQWPEAALADYLEYLTKATCAVLDIARAWADAKRRVVDAVMDAAKQGPQ
jgi:hypothetical protein